MRIGINCLNLDPGYVGGVNTYALGLLSGFAEAHAQDFSFEIFASSHNRSFFARFEGKPGFHVHVCEDIRSVPKRALRKLALKTGSPALFRLATDTLFAKAKKLIEEKSDLVYTPTTILFPFALARPQLLSMHDIQHVHFPEFFSAAEVRSRSVNFGLSARHSSYFQASSEFIRDDLLSHYRFLRPEQIAVIPEGVSIEEFQAPRNPDLRDKYGLPEHFLFYPAQLWKHKDHLTVLRALRSLSEKSGPHIPLVLTGARMSAADEIFEFIEKNSLEGIHYLGKVPFADLVSLYQEARFTITAALYESSSLCLLEAAAAGSALLASRTRPNQEMGANLQVNFFEPGDSDGLAALLGNIWGDDTNRQSQIAGNRQAIHCYSWKSIAERYLTLFRQLRSAALE